MKSVHWIAIGALIPIALIVAWSMLDTACTLEAASAAKETVRECYRNWFGALSGWAAAIVASFTIVALLHQIKKTGEFTHRQQDEAKEVFDREISRLLIDVNDAWKHAEDFFYFQNTYEDPETAALRVQFAFGEAEKLLESEEQTFADLIKQMHANDAVYRKKLIKNLKSCVSTIYITEATFQFVEDNEPDLIQREARGGEYLYNAFIRCFEFGSVVRNDLPELSEVFSNRATSADVPDVRETLRRNLFGDLPEYPENPY